MSWYWRTKPRSIIKTIQWFPYFGKLQGQNWNETSTSVSAFNQKKIYPVRRSYIYHAHGEEDGWLSTISYEDYLSGSYDRKETESNGRNDKSTYEFLGFGYVSKKGNINITECGHQIIQNQFDQEQYLKQLLKLHLPNPIQKIFFQCNLFYQHLQSTKASIEVSLHFYLVVMNQHKSLKCLQQLKILKATMTY